MSQQVSEGSRGKNSKRGQCTPRPVEPVVVVGAYSYETESFESQLKLFWYRFVCAHRKSWPGANFFHNSGESQKLECAHRDVLLIKISQNLPKFRQNVICDCGQSVKGIELPFSGEKCSTFHDPVQTANYVSRGHPSGQHLPLIEPLLVVIKRLVFSPGVVLSHVRVAVLWRLFL